MGCDLGGKGKLRRQLAQAEENNRWWKEQLTRANQKYDTCRETLQASSRELTELRRDSDTLKTLQVEYNLRVGRIQVQNKHIETLEELTLRQKADLARLNNPPPERPDLGTMPVGKLSTAYGKLYGVDWVAANNCKIVGDVFNRVCIEDVMKFTEWTQVSSIRYTEIVKCGEFALALVGQVPMTAGWRGIPMGYLSVYIPDVGWHAVVTVFALPTRESKTEKIYYIEPQQGTGIPFDKASKWSPGLLLMV